VGLAVSVQESIEPLLGLWGMGQAGQAMLSGLVG